jgi:hypothetical protein
VGNQLIQVVASTVRCDTARAPYCERYPSTDTSWPRNGEEPASVLSVALYCNELSNLREDQ